MLFQGHAVLFYFDSYTNAVTMVFSLLGDLSALLGNVLFRHPCRTIQWDQCLSEESKPRLAIHYALVYLTSSVVPLPCLRSSSSLKPIEAVT